MSLVLEEIRTPRKVYDCTTTPGRYLTLGQYLVLARRMIAKFAPRPFRKMMLGTEDAIDYVAHKVMRADWEFDPHRNLKMSTWRGYCAKRAITKYLTSWHRAQQDGPDVYRLGIDLKDREVMLAVRERPISFDEIKFDDQDMYDVKQPSEEPDHCRMEEQEDRRARLCRLMEPLSPQQRRCVTLHFLEDMTPHEIARGLGITREGVRKVINRAIAIMREKSHAQDTGGPGCDDGRRLFPAP